MAKPEPVDALLAIVNRLVAEEQIEGPFWAVQAVSALPGRVHPSGMRVAKTMHVEAAVDRIMGEA